MLKEITIKNFRCFEETTVSEFARVNFIVGQNATGKTALLEGIRAALGGTVFELISINQFRGIYSGNSNISLEEYDLLWDNFFYNLERDRNIEFFYIFQKDNIINTNFNVTLGYEKDKKNLTSELRSDLLAVLTGEIKASSYNPFFIIRNDHLGADADIVNVSLIKSEDRNIFNSRKAFSNYDMVLEFSNSTFQNVEYISPNLRTSSDLVTKRYSKLSKNNKENLLLSNLQKLFPLIISLSLEQESGEFKLYANVKNVYKKISANFLSDGINKVIFLLLAIIDNKNGVVLIDEIENGLHVSILERFWEVLYQAAVENNVQLFITSHSKECMEAAKKVIDENSNDFALYRMERRGVAICVLKFSGEEFKTALEYHSDVR